MIVSFLVWIGHWCHIFAGSENYECLALGLSKLIDLILLAEVDLVDGLLDFALVLVFERRDLIMLGERVARHHVGGHADAELVVGVQVHLFLQLSSHILVVVGVWS